MEPELCRVSVITAQRQEEAEGRGFGPFLENFAAQQDFARNKRGSFSKTLPWLWLQVEALRSIPGSITLGVIRLKALGLPEGPSASNRNSTLVSQSANGSPPEDSDSPGEGGAVSAPSPAGSPGSEPGGSRGGDRRALTLRAPGRPAVGRTPRTRLPRGPDGKTQVPQPRPPARAAAAAGGRDPAPRGDRAGRRGRPGAGSAGSAMEPPGGAYLHLGAVASPVGTARVLQLAFGCATFSLVAHRGGFAGAQGAFCMAAWGFCFALSALVVACELTRLHGCLRLSWGNFTAAFAMLATLLCATAAVIYPLYFARLRCPPEPAGCLARDFRLAASVFAGLLVPAYAAEVALTRARPGQVASYMATVSGLLKVVQAFVACIIFGALVHDSRYARFVATQWCVAVYSLCFLATVVVVALSVTGRTAGLGCPFDRLVVVYTFLAVLLYLSAAVIWPVFCFDPKYGEPQRPPDCPRGSCFWDSQLVVAVFTYVNLLLYVVDLAYSQRIRFVPSL
ncbi:myeloid-associated differentiation marker-like protein 2 [Ctenodactylus gundi]